MRYPVALALIALCPCGLAQGCTYTCNPGMAFTLNCPGGACAGITVTDAIAITDIDVRAVITYNWIGDLSLSLPHVDTGTTIWLMEIPGAAHLYCAGSTGCNTANIDWTFDDAAAAVADLCPGSPNNVRPDQALSAFNGDSSAGVWRLTVWDSIVFDNGTLDTWTLIFNGGAGACTAACGGASCGCTGPDDCAGAQDLGWPLPASVSGSTTDCTDDYTGSCGGAGGLDHVYSFTPLDDAQVTIDTCGGGLSFDGLIYVYETNCGVGGSEVASDDGGAGCGEDQVSFCAPSGTTYYVVIDGTAAAEWGAYDLNFTTVAGCGPPNDTCATATAIAGEGSWAFDTNDGVTFDHVGAPWPGPECFDLWYSWTPDCDGNYIFSTCGDASGRDLMILHSACGSLG